MNATIIYWSGTGHTKELAENIKNTISPGLPTDLYEVNDANFESIKNSDIILLGSPAMGAEEPADDMVSFIDKHKELMKDKKVILFGTYGWGDGEWIENWEEELFAIGINVISKLAIQEDDEYNSDSLLSVLK